MTETSSNKPVDPSLDLSGADFYNRGDQAFTRESPYGTRPEATYAGALSFLRRRYSRDLKDVDLAVLGVPYDLAVTNRPGTRFGPRGIRAASTQLSWSRPWPWEFDPFDRLSVVDYGDCVFDHGRPHQIPAEIEKTVAGILAQGAATLCLGGDHFITYPVLRAQAAKHGALSLIHFDAHSDTWSDEDGRIDHGTMFFHAAQEGIVDPSRSIQVGMRTVNDETHGFTVLDGRQVHAMGIEATIARIRQTVGNHPCYVTFDVDFLDPSCAPGTGTPVIGGFTTHQAQELIRGLRGINLIGMDVVEVSPSYDVAEITSLAGATIALELICVFADRFPERAHGQ